MKFKRHRKKSDTLISDKKPFFQPKPDVFAKEDPQGIKISSPNGKSEKQADAIADRVVNGTNQIPSEEPAIIKNQEKPAFAKASEDKEEEPAAKLEMQRQEEEENAAKFEALRQEEEETATKSEVQRQEEEEPATKLEVQRQEEESTYAKATGDKDEEIAAKSEIQRKEEKGKVSSLAVRIENAKSGGDPLPDKIRKEMDKKLNFDFLKVRIHTNKKAVNLCREIKAQAFANGYHIFFNKGKFRPDSSQGKHLLAHELAHVVQQKGN